MTVGDGGPDMVVPWAKTAVPHVPPRQVSRPRLLATLDAAGADQLVVVTGPAGYGKTLLLAEWAATRADRVAWVSLDDDDTTAHRFWSAVLAALAGCAAVPDDGALGRLAAPTAVDPDPEFLAAWVAAVAALPVPVTLVLDDVHELTASAPVRALATVVRERPRTLGLVLAGRSDPRLPVARMRLAGELCEIRARDLAFSTPEAGALLAGADVAVTPAQVGLLVGETEGWAAGLRLAALSLRTAPDPDRFLADLVGNSKATSDYLVGEILSRLPPDVCDLLRAVSVGDQLTAGLAATLSDRTDAGDVLAALEQETSLVLSSGAGRVSYRIHPLLRAHLRADLARRRPELVGRLHGRAADWFAARDRSVPALSHARQAQDPARVRALLERHVTAVLAAGDHAAVCDAVAFLAGRVDPADPFLALVEALVAAETGAAADVERHQALADSSWPADPPPALAALRALVRSRAAGLAGDPARMVRVAAELDTVGPRADPELVALGRLDSALTHLVSGRPDEGRRLAEEVLATARDHDHGYLAARALAVLATIAGAEGDYGRMARLGDRAAEELARGSWQATAGAGLVTAVRAYVAVLDLRPERCLELLGPSRPAGSGVAALDPMGAALRAAALTDLERTDEAVAALRPAVGALTAQPAPVRLVGIAGLLVHGAATQLGQHDVAAEVLRLAEDVLGRSGDVVLMRARRAVAEPGPRPGRDRSTEAELRAVVDGSTPSVVNWARIEARVVLGRMALAAGRRPQARQELDRALHTAATAGPLRPLLAGGPAVVDLLARQLGSFGAGDAAAARVLAHHGVVRAADAGLTDRERDVLALLASSGSLGEIAARLDVAPSTVKTHLRAVYGKLGVASRREAVAVGRRRGLLVGTDGPA